MIKKANITWTAKQLVKMVEKGTITMDNAVQRGYVWDRDRKSLLIHSMMEGYPIPPFYAQKNDNMMSLLDGKQRCNAIADFVNGKYALSDGLEVQGEEEPIDVSGRLFKEIPEELQDAIQDYSFTIYYFDDASENEIAEIFYRLNNGKALSSFDVMRTKIKCKDKIIDLSKHDIFTNVLTQKDIQSNKSEELAMKAWAIVYMDQPSFERKYLEEEITNADITDEEVFRIKEAFIRLQNVYKLLVEYESKEYTRSAKRMMMKTHFLSLIPVALKSKDDGISVEDYMEFVQKFFSGKKSATNNYEYNRAAGSGSAKCENIDVRLNEIEKDYKKYFKQE